MMHPTSAEATVVRNYLDWIAALPWHEKSEENYDLAIAETVLDEDHYGLRKIKERIIEYLAVQALVRKLKGPVLCFCGPPGVGKTSLAKSIARATGRKFARIALGGVRDEAEIRGHRRTYIGAMPGKLVQTLKKVGTDNPVILLDEIDKLASDFRGDPAAALLEVLDPEQNHSFADHYMDLDYDLSDVMFITTANSLSAIPVPLQDRMEIIELSGYTEFEKMNIATKYLLPRQAKECGLDGVDFKVSESALRTIIHHYTSEAGVRNLEREIGSVARKAARKVVETGKETKINVLAKDVPQFLGVPKYRLDKKEEKDQVGLTNGLYVTSVGGGLLSCEASVVPGKGKIVITGRLEKGMEESMQAAMSYIRSRSALLGLADNFHETIDIHVHFPDFVQKDGPSAGVTAATSIASALLKLPVRRDVAMTGEITLRGRVMPIGGVKEKLLGAHRAGITTVFIPAENQHHLFEVPRRVLKAMRIVLVDSADQVLREAIRFPNADAVFGPRPATLEYRNGDLLETSELPAPPATPVPPARPSGTALGTEEAVRTATRS
jgi:ATP-dependent Lon protease